MIGKASPKKQRDDDGHRLACAGRQCPADDFLDVVIDRAPFAHRRGDRGEVVVGQHDLGGLLRRFAALSSHGDTRIRAFQGRRVVDAVAGHGDGQPMGLQRGHQTQLVLGAGSGEDIRLDNGGVLSSDVTHALRCRLPVEHAVRVLQANLPGYRLWRFRHDRR